jgi:putative redox protein
VFGYNPRMAGPSAPTAVELVWERDLVFSGRSGDVSTTLDSASVAGVSPMQALAFALSGCMAMDVVHILRKARQDLKGLRATLNGARAAEHPRRFTSVDLHYSITGVVDPAQVQRAIELSRDKYCSVWHSLRQDIVLNITFKVSGAA